MRQLTTEDLQVELLPARELMGGCGHMMGSSFGHPMNTPSYGGHSVTTPSYGHSSSSVTTIVANNGNGDGNGNSGYSVLDGSLDGDTIYGNVYIYIYT